MRWFWSERSTIETFARNFWLLRSWKNLMKWQSKCRTDRHGYTSSPERNSRNFRTDLSCCSSPRNSMNRLVAADPIDSQLWNLSNRNWRVFGQLRYLSILVVRSSKLISFSSRPWSSLEKSIASKLYRFSGSVKMKLIFLKSFFPPNSRKCLRWLHLAPNTRFNELEPPTSSSIYLKELEGGTIYGCRTKR